MNKTVVTNHGHLCTCKIKNPFSCSVKHSLLLVNVNAREHKLRTVQKDGRGESGAAGFYERVTLLPIILKIWPQGTLYQTALMERLSRRADFKSNFVLGMKVLSVSVTGGSRKGRSSKGVKPRYSGALTVRPRLSIRAGGGRGFPLAIMSTTSGYFEWKQRPSELFNFPPTYCIYPANGNRSDSPFLVTCPGALKLS